MRQATRHGCSVWLAACCRDSRRAWKSGKPSTGRFLTAFPVSGWLLFLILRFVCPAAFSAYAPIGAAMDARRQHMVSGLPSCGQPCQRQWQRCRWWTAGTAPPYSALRVAWQGCTPMAGYGTHGNYIGNQWHMQRGHGAYGKTPRHGACTCGTLGYIGRRRAHGRRIRPMPPGYWNMGRGRKATRRITASWRMAFPKGKA